MARGDAQQGIGIPKTSRDMNQLPPIKRVVFSAEKTFSSIDPRKIPPLEVILDHMSSSKTDEVACPRFKEWTADEEGLEFTLGVVKEMCYHINNQREFYGCAITI